MQKLPSFVLRALLAALGALLFVAAAHAEPSDKSIDGIWEGTLQVNGGIELRLAFKFTKQPEGGYRGTLDSIDQGARDIPIDEVVFKEREVTATLKGIKATFFGRLSQSGDTLAGTFTQSGKLPLTLKRVDKVSAPSRPQEPQRPFPYREVEVSFDSSAPDVKLAGTLTVPEGDGPFPAVLLVSGSGPQDRDEQLLGHKPFLVLADHLTRRGIAVLRYDDRGVGKSTGKFSTATSLDFLEDALAGVAFLKSRTEVNPRRIGIAGHSEGGLIAPLAATRSPDVAFIVLLAGPALTGAEILLAQGALIARGMGAGDPIIAWNGAIQKRSFEIVRTEKDDAAAKVRLRTAIREEFDKLPADLRTLILANLAAAQKPDADDEPARPKDTPTPEERLVAMLEQQTAQVLTPWFRFFISYDPRPTLEQVQCPVLALIGEKDLQVPAADNIPELKRALERGNNRDATVTELPGLNHLFQACKTGLPAEYSRIEETFSPAALELIANWILARR